MQASLRGKKTRSILGASNCVIEFRNYSWKKPFSPNSLNPINFYFHCFHSRKTYNGLHTSHNWLVANQVREIQYSKIKQQVLHIKLHQASLEDQHRPASSFYSSHRNNLLIHSCKIEYQYGRTSSTTIRNTSIACRVSGFFFSSSNSKTHKVFRCLLRNVEFCLIPACLSLSGMESY